MQLHINEPIHEDHFHGTFTFPNDLDFIGVEIEHQCFVDLFNKEIERRVKHQEFLFVMSPEFVKAKKRNNEIINTNPQPIRL